MQVWDPFKMTRRMSNLWDDDFGVMEWDNTEMDMYEEDDKVVVKLKAPGFDEKNVDISVDDNSVTITGKMETREEEEDKKKKFFRKEIRSQSFARTVTLPTKILADQAEAKFKNGILRLTLPKAEEVKPKKIQIKPEK